jgi:luciferase family oxidoreductase group 1
MQALRRNLQAKIDDFPRDVVELQSFLKEAQPNQSITAVPGVGTNVPLWILGSSLFGAQLAAMLGLPFAFASHFAPAYMQAAIDMYRDRFQPSEQLQVPYIMLGFNLCAAESSTEASYLRSSSLQSFINLRRGQPGPLPPPIEDFDNQMSVSEQQMLSEISHCSAIGDADMVEQQIQQFIDRTGADELMIVSSMFDHHKRLQSYEIGAEIMKRLPSHSKPDTASA